jgi:hypothetical protein
MKRVFAPKKHDVEELPLCLLKQHGMNEYGDVKCVLINGYIYILTCSYDFSSIMFVYVLTIILDSSLC